MISLPTSSIQKKVALFFWILVLCILLTPLSLQAQNTRKAPPKDECDLVFGGFSASAPGARHTLQLYELANPSVVAAQLGKSLGIQTKFLCKSKYYFNSGFGYNGGGGFQLSNYGRHAMNTSTDSKDATSFLYLDDKLYAGATEFQFTRDFTFSYDLNKGERKYPFRFYTSFVISLTHYVGDAYLTHAASRSAGCTTAVSAANPDPAAIQTNCTKLKLNETFFTSYQEKGLLWAIQSWAMTFQLYQRSATKRNVDSLYQIKKDDEMILSIYGAGEF